MLDILLEALKGWGLIGVILACALAAIGWLARHSVKRMEAQIKKMEEDQDRRWAQVRIALLECRAETVIDHDRLGSMKTIAAEFRALAVATFTGQRSRPPEMAAIDARYMELRRRIHDDVNRRAEALKIDILKEEVIR